MHDMLLSLTLLCMLRHPRHRHSSWHSSLTDASAPLSCRPCTYRRRVDTQPDLRSCPLCNQARLYVPSCNPSRIWTSACQCDQHLGPEADRSCAGPLPGFGAALSSLPLLRHSLDCCYSRRRRCARPVLSCWLRPSPCCMWGRAEPAEAPNGQTLSWFSVFRLARLPRAQALAL